MTDPSNDPVTRSTLPNIPLWFWVVSGIALLWNLLGLVAFIAQCMMSEAALAEQPEEVQELYRNMPAWFYIAFGMAVIGGTLGSLGLLRRKKWSVACFAMSLLGIIGQQIYFYLLSNTMQVMGTGAMVFQTVVLLIAVVLLALALKAQSQDWLRTGI